MTQTVKKSQKTSNFSLFSLKMRHFSYKSPRKRGRISPAVTIHRGDFCQKKYVGKERDNETGLYYYGARYLDSKTGRWLSGDPAVGEYVPSAPINDETRKRNESLPGMGGVFNYVNLHVYHYAGNNPVKLVDPDGRVTGWHYLGGSLIATGITVAVVGIALSGGTGTLLALKIGGEMVAAGIGIMALGDTVEKNIQQGQSLTDRARAAAPAPSQPPQNNNDDQDKINRSSKQSVKDAKRLDDRGADRFAKDGGYRNTHDLKRQQLQSADISSENDKFYDVHINNKTNEAFLIPKQGHQNLPTVKIE